MIGARLLALREDADMSQSQLGEILNVSKHAISSYEREKTEPPDAVKIAIARYFNVSVDYLLGLTDVPAPIERQTAVLRLPKDFPHSKLPELKRYARFLAIDEKGTAEV